MLNNRMDGLQNSGYPDHPGHYREMKGRRVFLNRYISFRFIYFSV